MSDLQELELDTNAFFNSIFNTSPMPPFSYRIEIIPDMLNTVLQSFVLGGCTKLYPGINLHQLNQRQIGTLREYLLSIGYDIEYNLIEESKIIKDYHPDGSPFLRKLNNNRYNFTFKQADPQLNNYNSHIGHMF